jgi:16S rRNA (uracil1498-N3)-methyltransferase
MARRVHVRSLEAGKRIALDRGQAHHARDVLRLPDGGMVEVFDDAGAIAQGVLSFQDGNAYVEIGAAHVHVAPVPAVSLTVASAVPKGDRADWMVEKLSELGVSEFIPLAAARSVVLPEGKGKHDRWVRIATEAAKQSRRAGVMRITELMKPIDAIRVAPRSWFLSTESERPTAIGEAVQQLRSVARLTAFIGPEGGWTAQEQQLFLAAGATPVRLTGTVLRIETASVVTAAMVGCATAGDVLADPLDGPSAADDDRASDDSTVTETPP